MTMNRWIVLAAVVVAGCTSSSERPSSEAESASQKPAAAPAATEAPTHATEAPSAHSAEAHGAAATATPVALVGTSGCGHCTFQVGTSCAAALKTADGTLYIIDGVDPESEMYKTRMDGKSLKVMGAVSEKDGLHHVAMTSYEIL